MVDDDGRATVERTIEAMWQRYGESLSLRDLADIAPLSKHYFSRLFHSVTGTSPCRFLTAIRLHEAKRMLRETTLSVTDISYRVGYNSPGTFTSRFTYSVGATPVSYRSMARTGTLPRIAVPPGAADRAANIHGTIVVPRTGVPLRVFVGAFKSPFMEGRPGCWDVLESSGTYRLAGLADGVCFVRAAAVPADDVADGRAGWPVLVGSCRPTRVSLGPSVRADLALQRPSPIDPPILTAVPELDSRRVRSVPPGRFTARGRDEGSSRRS